ncbi:MAG: hypothetical protein Q9165_003880 [Trypethelium subeluteriae]
MAVAAGHSFKAIPSVRFLIYTFYPQDSGKVTLLESLYLPTSVIACWPRYAPGLKWAIQNTSDPDHLQVIVMLDDGKDSLYRGMRKRALEESEESVGPVMERIKAGLELPHETSCKASKLDAVEKQARLSTPRYLFRAYCTESDGGWPGLNSPAAIVPHAFLFGGGHESIYDIRTLRDMIETHHAMIEGASEFSSWFTSFLTVLAFVRYAVDHDSYICCLDTTKLPEDRRVYPIPALEENGIADIPTRLTELECFAHGVIEGECFVSVRYQDLVTAGILRFLPPPDPYKRSEFGQADRDDLWSQPSQRLTQEEVDTAFKVGLLFGVDKTLPIALSLLAFRPRQEKDENGKSVFLQEDVTLIMDAIRQHSLTVPSKWLDDFIKVPNPFPLHKGIVEIEQMIYLIRTILSEAFAEQKPERDSHLFKEKFSNTWSSIGKIAGNALRKLSTLSFRTDEKAN